MARPLLLEIVTWLILPVVICLSQRLSHACLSINIFIPWNCVQLIISVIIYLMVPYYMDTRSNSRANTCTKSWLFWEGMYLLDKKPMHPLGGLWWFIITLTDRTASRRRQFIQISALSAFDGSVVDYRGINGWRRIRVRFRRGSLRNGYHIQGRQQARKLPNPDTGR